jgi:trk system potassium uptake protein TrkH
VITATIGLLPVLTVKPQKEFSNKESYCIVIGAWLASCLVGMIPYLLWGGEFTLGKAWFESVSGYTSTGATILGDVEALPRGLLLWRSCTLWMGGAGVVMFALLIMPMLGRSRMMVSSVELSTVARDDYKYKSGTVVRIMLTVYLGLTAACLVALKIAGMGWFDALNHAMSTAATGGFSTKNMSVGFWNSPAIETVLVVFMFIGSIHFGVTFATLTGRRKNIFRSEVVRYYLIFLLCAIIAVAAGTYFNGTYASPLEALLRSSFTTVSLASSTGFTSHDPNLWGPLATTILVFAGIQGACAGSTGGGLKADRILLAGKIIRHQIRQQQHPNAIIRIKLNGVTQDPSVMGFVMLYIVLFVLLMVFGTIFVAAFGYDVLTSFSISAASLSNLGQMFGQLGGFDSFAALPGPVRILSTVLMLLGRLEIFGLLQLFLLKWWK